LFFEKFVAWMLFLQ